MTKFRSLEVWKESKDLAVKIYSLTNDGDIARDYGLRDQIRRSAVSIPSNIAEGDDLGTDKQSTRHFNIAKGSLAELRTQLEIAHEIGYLTKDIYQELERTCDLIAGKLTKLIAYRSQHRK